MHDLNTFAVADMAECTRAVQRIGEAAACMEDVAAGIARYLYEELGDGRGEPAAVLVRCFKTHDFGGLEPELQEAAREALGGSIESAGLKCLVLLGTAGRRPEWNSRRSSAGHRAIPLPSPRVVERMPMISQLVRQLGFEVAEIVRPDPELVMELEGRSTNVFFVEDAQGSPYIPAQAEFVEPHGVRSVIGFGALLPSGNLFATIVFTRLKLPRERAELFRILAMSVKAAVLRFDWGPTFAAARASEAGS